MNINIITEWFIAIPLAVFVYVFWYYALWMSIKWVNDFFCIGWLGSIDFHTREITVYDLKKNAFLVKKGKVNKMFIGRIGSGTLAIQFFGVWFLWLIPMFIFKKIQKNLFYPSRVTLDNAKRFFVDEKQDWRVY